MANSHSIPPPPSPLATTSLFSCLWVCFKGSFFVRDFGDCFVSGLINMLKYHFQEWYYFSLYELIFRALCLILLIHYRYRVFGIDIKGQTLDFPSGIFRLTE